MEQIKILIDADVFQRLEEKIDGLTEELANRDKLMTASFAICMFLFEEPEKEE